MLAPSRGLISWSSSRLPGAVNVVFPDGHGELVKLDRLWEFYWDREFKPRKRPCPSRPIVPGLSLRSRPSGAAWPVTQAPTGIDRSFFEQLFCSFLPVVDDGLVFARNRRGSPDRAESEAITARHGDSGGGRHQKPENQQKGIIVMKNSVLKQPIGAICACAMPAALLALLLWAPPAGAGEWKTADIRATMVALNQGEWTATPSGNLRIIGATQVLMFESENPLFTGRFTWEGDANADAALNGICVCRNIFEVGTWEQDPESGEWVFTPSPGGGVFAGVALAKGNLFGPFDVKGEAHGILGELKKFNIHLEGHADSLFGEQSYTVEYLDPKAKKLSVLMAVPAGEFRNQAQRGNHNHQRG